MKTVFPRRRHSPQIASQYSVLSRCIRPWFIPQHVINYQNVCYKAMICG